MDLPLAALVSLAMASSEGSSTEDESLPFAGDGELYHDLQIASDSTATDRHQSATVQKGDSFNYGLPAASSPEHEDENTQGNYIQSAVVDTIFCYHDLGAAISAGWTVCRAVQPFLARAVELNGGHARYVGVAVDQVNGAFNGFDNGLELSDASAAILETQRISAQCSSAFKSYELPPLFQPRAAQAVAPCTQQQDCKQQ